jgi:Protein of Unknown function (DUF2784)
LLYLWLADAIVAVHLSYACFVLFGFLAILAGLLLGWNWTRSLKFRIVHLICTVLVGVESLWGVTCPLTTLENFLLQKGGRAGYERSFIGRLMNQVLFYDAPEELFTFLYLLLSALTLLTFIPVVRKSFHARA